MVVSSVGKFKTFFWIYEIFFFIPVSKYMIFSPLKGENIYIYFDLDKTYIFFYVRISAFCRFSYFFNPLYLPHQILF